MDTEEVEDTYVRTAARMSRMSLPIFVSCRACSVQHRDTGTVMAPTVGAGLPTTALSELEAYQWDSLYHRMRHRPVGGIDRADTSLSPLYAGLGGTKWHNRPVFRGLPTAKSSPCFSYEMGLTCRLTGQGQEWEAVLK